MSFDEPVIIKFICPVCKSSKELKIAKSVLNQLKKYLISRSNQKDGDYSEKRSKSLRL